MLQKILICTWAALANPSSSYSVFLEYCCYLAQNRIKYSSALLFSARIILTSSFFLPLKSMKKHTTTPKTRLPDLHMAKAPIDMDEKGFYLHFILFSEYWLSQQFPTLIYAQSKHSPSSQIKHQPGCLFTDTFLRWSKTPALLEQSPTPGEMPRTQVNFLERFTHPLMFLLWPN